MIKSILSACFDALANWFTASIDTLGMGYTVHEFRSILSLYLAYEIMLSLYISRWS